MHLKEENISLKPKVTVKKTTVIGLRVPSLLFWQMTLEALI